jgi:hypothetical protein
METLKML